MAVYHEDVVNIDLGNGTTHRNFMNHTIGEGDENANRYGARLFKGNEPVSLAGYTAVGYFVRADQTTVVILGVVTGNEVYVILPEECYAVEGNFALVIKIIGGTYAGTMRIIDGTVVNTSTGGIVDPGGIIPDIDELLAVIGRAEAAVADISKFIVTEELISGTDYRLIVDVDED